MLNPLEEIISLLRGYFACPIISTLGKEGVLNSMLQKKDGFSREDFPKVTNKKIFEAILVYLLNLSLLMRNENGKYYVTELGAKVFNRYGSYCLLHSYGSFLNELDAILFDPDFKTLPKCDRLTNIIGSGQANGKKYFPVAMEIMKKHKVQTVLDIGCGDGYFLSKVLESFPNINVFGVDISEISVAVTERNLRSKFPEASIKTFLSSGDDIEKWASWLLADSESGTAKQVITMWYLLHEISKNDKNVVIGYFRKLNQFFPKTSLMIGEIVAVPPDILAQNRSGSVIPEYLFFHQISGQGVLSWVDYQEILKNIPYVLEDEKLFNVVSSGKEAVPSSFIWHLSPK